MQAIGIQFKVIYVDVHLVEIRVSAWNGAFGGAADVYVGLDEIEEVARKLAGFPKTISDTREVVMGQGDVSVRLYCRDHSGHSYMDLKIETMCLSTSKIQSMTCSFAIEAAAIDSFVEELSRMGANRAGQAFLRGTE